MLFRLIPADESTGRIEPVPFQSFAQFGLEKDLENLIAQNLFGVLFEHSPLMPIFQEQPLQAETDIYALNDEGELYIFELKLRVADC